MVFVPIFSFIDIIRLWKSEKKRSAISELHFNRLGSRFRVNETSQISERYSVQIKAPMKQKRLVMFGQMYLSMIECPKHYWHTAFSHKRLCYWRFFLFSMLSDLLIYSTWYYRIFPAIITLEQYYVVLIVILNLLSMIWKRFLM